MDAKLLPDLLVFLEAARSGSLTQAAQRLNTVQPNVTARIRKLEQALGTKLLQRHARGVRPTPAGEAVRTRITVTGVVQGVGFRPFVHRLATELGVTGFVGNDAAAVFIEAQGPPRTVSEFTMPRSSLGPRPSNWHQASGDQISGVDGLGLLSRSRMASLQSAWKGGEHDIVPVSSVKAPI